MVDDGATPSSRRSTEPRRPTAHLAVSITSTRPTRSVLPFPQYFMSDSSLGFCGSIAVDGGRVERRGPVTPLRHPLRLSRRCQDSEGHSSFPHSEISYVFVLPAAHCKGVI